MVKFNLKKLQNEAKNRREKRMLIFFMVKLGFSKKNPAGRVSLARHVILNMTGNPNFTTPMPTLASVGIAADDLETAQAALDGTKAKTIARNLASKALADKMKQLQAYVDAVANGDQEVALSSGMEINDAKTPIGKLGPVTGVTVKLGEFVGSIDIKWNPIKKSKLFTIEYRNDSTPANEWEFAGETSKSKFTVENLESNVIYSFRIMCISSGGIGVPSELVSIRVY